MFQIGSTVMHPTAGVCTITDLRKEKFSGSWELYYCLQPVFDSANNRIYVPVNSEKVVLRQLISKAQINEILAQAGGGETVNKPEFSKNLTVCFISSLSNIFIISFLFLKSIFSLS